jgi:hypothetical protein
MTDMCKPSVTCSNVMMLSVVPDYEGSPIVAFSLTAKLSPKAKEDIFDPLHPPTLFDFSEFPEKSKDK